jgi:hypothetical protein
MRKIDIVRQAVEKFPNTAKKTIANYIFKHNPGLFKDQEAARRYVRGICGTAGNKNPDSFSFSFPQPK